MKLATLIILLGTISVSLLFASMAVIIYVDFPAQQDRLLRQRGIVLADNLRRQIEPAVITGDRLHLDEAIARTKLSDKDVEYVVVLDAIEDHGKDQGCYCFYGCANHLLCIPEKT